MIQLISREEVFCKSWVVDHYISDCQKSRYDPDGYDLAGYIDEKAGPVEDPFDHLEPFHDQKEGLDDFAVLGYIQNKPDYLTHRSTAFIHFFELLDIKQLYLLDQLKYDWLQFPFSYREKRDAFKSIVKQPAYQEAFEVDISDLSQILPLFHFSGRHSTPIVWFFSANSQIELAMFLCDDNNLHTSFQKNDREKIRLAASAAGLVMGGLEVCQI